MTNIAPLARGTHRLAYAVDDVLDGATAVQLARERLHEARPVSRDDAVLHLVRIRVMVRDVGLGLGVGVGVGFHTAMGEKKYEYTPTPTAVCRAAVTLYLVRVGARVGARVLAES